MVLFHSIAARGVASCLAALLACAVTPPAAGQILDRTPAVRLAAIVSSEYNDNLLFDQAAAARATWSAVAVPQLSLEYGRGSRTAATLELQETITRYFSAADFNRNLPSLAFRARHEFPISVLSATGSYVRTSGTRPEAAGLMDATVRTAAMDLTGEFGRKGSYRAGLSEASTSYDDPRNLAQSSQVAAVDLGHFLRPKLQTGLAVSHAWEQIGPARHAGSTVVGAFLIGPVSPKTEVNVRLGATNRRSDLGVNATVLDAHAAVTNQWTEKTRTVFSLGHQPQVDLSGRESRTWYAAWAVNVQARPHVFMYAKLRYDASSYPAIPGAFGPLPGYAQKYGSGEVGLSYRLRSWCALGGSVRRQQVDSRAGAAGPGGPRRASQTVFQLSVNLRH